MSRDIILIVIECNSVPHTCPVIEYLGHHSRNDYNFYPSIICLEIYFYKYFYSVFLKSLSKRKKPATTQSQAYCTDKSLKDKKYKLKSFFFCARKTPTRTASKTIKQLITNKVTRKLPFFVKIKKLLRKQPFSKRTCEAGENVAECSQTTIIPYSFAPDC